MIHVQYIMQKMSIVLFKSYPYSLLDIILKPITPPRPIQKWFPTFLDMSKFNPKAHLMYFYSLLLNSFDPFNFNFPFNFLLSSTFSNFPLVIFFLKWHLLTYVPIYIPQGELRVYFLSPRPTYSYKSVSIFLSNCVYSVDITLSVTTSLHFPFSFLFLSFFSFLNFPLSYSLSPACQRMIYPGGGGSSNIRSH